MKRILLASGLKSHFCGSYRTQQLVVFSAKGSQMEEILARKIKN